MFNKICHFLIVLVPIACYTDYGIMKPGEKEYVYVTETETVVEEVEVEVEAATSDPYIFRCVCKDR